MSFLIFDVDHSLASIGGDKAAEELSAFPPIKVTDGIAEVNGVIHQLFVKQQREYTHPLIPQSIRHSVFEMNDTAKQFQVNGIVIDTISHLFRRDMRILEAKNKSERLEIQDWSKLDRVYNQFITSLIQLPVWVIVNSHITYDKNDLGQFLFYPLLKGASKEWITEYFDCVFFTKIRSTNNQAQYLWQTKPDSQRFAKDRLDILEHYIPQDLGFVISLYKRNGIEHPKILVIGESGTGKTRAIETLGNQSLFPILDKNNDKASSKLFN